MLLPCLSEKSGKVRCVQEAKMQSTVHLAADFTFPIFCWRTRLFKFRKKAEPIEIEKYKMNRRQYALWLQVPIVSKTYVSVTQAAVPLLRSAGKEGHGLQRQCRVTWQFILNSFGSKGELAEYTCIPKEFFCDSVCSPDFCIHVLQMFA